MLPGLRFAVGGDNNAVSMFTKVVTYEEADIRKIYLFFVAIGLPQPSLDEAQEFRDTYKAAYRENRRATPGSIKALARLV